MDEWTDATFGHARWRLRVDSNREPGDVPAGRSRERLTWMLRDLDVWTRPGIRAALGVVIELELAGLLAPTRAGNIVSALAIAAQNLDAWPSSSG